MSAFFSPYSPMHPSPPMMNGDEASEPAISQSPEPMAEDGTLDSSFQCCVCLDLLYKPIVLACGHISCFWCVHRAMHGLRTSNCAMCRQPYNHFPSICHLLHHLLVKMEPVAYKRREQEVLEEERRNDTFSPQFKDYVLLGNVPSGAEESISLENGIGNGMCKQVSVNDVLCGLCGQLLFKPCVLNCGHVYCESCLYGLGNDSLKCPDCQSMHPGGFPNVCLDLNHFLEEQFPEEYAKRKDRVQQRAQFHLGDSSSSLLEKKKDDYLSMDQDLHNVHVEVGCDTCGMYPIRGKRYKCKDCTEAIGFDLCEACYSSTSSLPGRFNQQHTPDHEFELDESNLLGRILLRSLRADQQEELVEELFFDRLSDNHDDPGHNNVAE